MDVQHIHLLVCTSHLVNVMVAGAFGVLLFRNLVENFPPVSARLEAVYGTDAPARRILACVYLAIALMSVACLASAEVLYAVSAPLFVMQIVYKVLTSASVGTLKHPVVVANLLISVLHAVSVYFLITT
ncbi:MAG: hypothetical protein GC134_00660 [Proteobacteria bacterium]|nr:hypothetical protein [Pseudomonadota bacterium]